jgi:DNA replicative helicase MCM subunit Mcm2 (Cdc46/Mcm family)
MPTILSRFDMIFIIKDEHDEKRDTVCNKRFEIQIEKRIFFRSLDFG